MQIKSQPYEGWDTALKPNSLIVKVRSGWKHVGIQARILTYLVVFVFILIGLLWLFQIVLLDDFYRYYKIQTLTSTNDTLVRNIDNEDLSSLADRISQQSDVCMLIVDQNMNVLVSADVNKGCILHNMSIENIKEFVDSAIRDGEPFLRTFSLQGFRNTMYDNRKFIGKVPPSDSGESQSMLYVNKITFTDGTLGAVLLNTIITPVTATVETLRSQLMMITVILLCLSIIMSIWIARHISQPLIDTNQAAKALSKGQYKLPHGADSYREIRELNHTLVNAAVDLDKVESLQRELIANISHDLRTPLTMIGGYAEVMRDIPMENTPENMQIIIDETKRLSTLVNAIMDFSKLQAGAIPQEKAIYCLTDSIQEIILRYEKLLGQVGYVIRFEQTEKVYISADETRLSQVLYNLINNAITYTGADKTVTISQTIIDSFVTISVSDTGPGIPADELALIWNRYYRSKETHKRAKIGTGLGLSIVKSILDTYQLTYGVESKEGQGTCFWFQVLASPGPKETHLSI